jgi:hypothetical protein
MKRVLSLSLALVAAAAGILVAAAIIGHHRANMLLQIYGSSSARADETEETGKPARPFASENEAMTAVFSAMNEKNPLRRAFEIYEALSRLDSAQLAAMANHIEALRDQRQRALLGPLLRRWQMVNADAAEAWTRTFTDRYVATGQSRDREVILAWSRAAPERALELALHTSDQALGAQIANAAVSALAGDHPAAISERLSQLPAGKLRERALAQNLAVWAEKDPAAAYAELPRLAPGRLADETRITVMKKWASTEPGTALQELEKLAPTLPASLYGNPLVRNVLSAVAENDPQVALSAIARLPENLRESATIAALVSWAGKDGVAALAWANAHHVPLDATSFQQNSDVPGVLSWSLADCAIESDKEEVAKWIRALPPSEERSRAILSILDDASPEQARELFGELPGAWQQSAISQTIWRGVSSDPDGTERWAMEMPNGPVRRLAIEALTAANLRLAREALDDILQRFQSSQDRDAVLNGAADAFTSEPRRAVEFAAQIENAPLRERAFRTIAGDWLSNDRAAATAWLLQTREISEESKRVLFRRADDRQVESGR